ncbi:MAG: zinc ribbon domain-containing protein [Bacteroidales bacterium]|nr:zinc ribbon domain-containing protein [Bacteroidales bacterium]
MPFCIICGAQIAPNNRFCPACGAAVEPDEAPQAAPQQAPYQEHPYQQPYQQPIQQPYQQPYQEPYQQPAQPVYPQTPPPPQNVVVEAAPVEEPVNVCSQCGAQLQPGTKFCMHCGGQASVRMVQNLLHHTFRAPSLPGEFSVPIGQAATGGLSAMGILSTGLQAARSATQQAGQSAAKSGKQKKSAFDRFMQSIGKRFIWAAISAGISYGGYYVYQHKDEIWAWITGLFS